MRRSVVQLADACDSTTAVLLRTALETAVPLWIERVCTWDTAMRDERQQVCADFIAAHGDNILYRSKKRGETATAFNRLAEGIALCAFVPGGVTVLGVHFVYEEKIDHA